MGLAVQLVYSHTIQALRGLQFLHDELRLTHGSVKLSNLLLAGPPAGPPAVRLAHMHAGEAFPPTCKGATRCRSPESLESGRVAREDDMFAVGCCVAAMATGVVDREKGIKGHFGNSPPLIQASGSGAALHLCILVPTRSDYELSGLSSGHRIRIAYYRKPLERLGTEGPA